MRTEELQSPPPPPGTTRSRSPPIRQPAPFPPPSPSQTWKRFIISGRLPPIPAARWSAVAVGVLVPSAPVGVANLQGRWNFDSENANDSSGTGRHGTAKKLFSLTASSDMKLWLDASDLSAAGASWDDDSGNSNDATKGGSPVVIENAQNGHSIMHYNADGQRHKFNMISDIRTVFWVISIDEAYKSSGFRYVLSDSTKHPHWHNNNDGKLFGSYSSSNITGGTIRLNGSTINGTTTNQPTSLSILTVKTTANVDADQFGYDRTITSRQWRGKLGELIIFNSAKSDADIEKIEGYLAHKWGLAGALASAHPHKLGAPIASSGSPTYITDTPFGSGKAIDLADGHVEVSTGESEDTFDGGSAFSVSAWVKGWPKKNPGVIVTKGATLPDPTEVPSMKLWLDSTALATMDQGNSLGATGTPTNGSNVHFWGDSSGNGYDGVRNSSNSPKYRSTSFNNGYSCVETSGGYFDISNSETDFDQWTGMTMVVAFKWTNTSIGDRLVYKGSTGWHNNVASYYIGKFNTGGGQGTGFWVADNGTRSKMDGNSYTDARSLEKIFAVKYDGSSLNSKFYINGAQVANHSMNSLFSSIPASSTSKVKVGGNYLIAELFMFDTALSDANREIIEGHLALRYGLFDSSHSGISTQGWGIGRGASSDAVSSFISNVGEYVSASSGASPSTDNQWHHVVSSYDGGTRKTYFDGTEVSSIEFSGQVTATNRTLVFGAIDFNSSAAAEEEVKNIAAANTVGSSSMKYAFTIPPSHPPKSLKCTITARETSPKWAGSPLFPQPSAARPVLPFPPRLRPTFPMPYITPTTYPAVFP